MLSYAFQASAKAVAAMDYTNATKNGLVAEFFDRKLFPYGPSSYPPLTCGLSAFIILGKLEPF